MPTLDFQKLIKKIIIYLVFILIIIFGIDTYQKIKAEKMKPVREVAFSCVNHTTYILFYTNTLYHIHPNLKILINGKNILIPKNIGIMDDCINSIHTHDESGKLHVEALVKKDFTLEDFFTIWGKTFNKNQILYSVVDNKKTILNITVNGIKVETYEKTLLNDLDNIVIEYKSI